MRRGEEWASGLLTAACEEGHSASLTYNLSGGGVRNVMRMHQLDPEEFDAQMVAEEMRERSLEVLKTEMTLTFRDGDVAGIEIREYLQQARVAP